jgi:tetratricopeptide (TPR) repeat protein
MIAALTPVEVFCCYCHADETWLQKLEVHLSLLKRQGLISLWYDRLIIPGADWTKSIDTHLETTSVILLLVSADFLASDYCYGIEMRRALERHQANEARIVPILLRPVDWKGAPFAHLQTLPTNAKAISTWSNQDEAFTDIVTAIRRAIEDLSLLESSPPRTALPHIWNIPYPHNSFFLGRDEPLLRLRTQLRAGQATAISQPQAISGLGGIGKTQIAVEYAYRYYQDYQAVLWARAESKEALVSSYGALAHMLSLSQRDEQDQAILVQAVKTWLQTHREWLLILDNADDLALIPEFLPPVLGGHLLLTTRASALGRLAHRIEIDTLSPEQGALLILRRAGILAPDGTLAQASVRDRELAIQISQELGGLPLALDQAGAYLEETGASLSDYQQAYLQHRVELLKQRRGLVADHPEPVATTWALAFGYVEESSLAAADLLRLCAYLAPEAIPEEVITQGAVHLGPSLESVAGDAFLLGNAIEALRSYSLISRDPSRHILSVHRLVQAVLRDAMDEADRQCWTERTIRAVHATLPSVDHPNWARWERLLAHTQACAEWAEREGICFQEAAQLLQQTGWYLTERARYDEAEPLLARAYQMSEQEQGAKHLDTARIASTLALLYQDQGKYEQAEPLFQRALAIYEQQLGAQHPDTANNLNNLARLYRDQGKYEQAEPLSQRALLIREQQLGVEHPHTASSLNNLALLYQDQGKYEQAESLFQRALLIREQQLGVEHPHTASSLNNLAGLYQHQGKYAEAEPLFQRALAIYEKQLSTQHPDTATSLGNLAELYWFWGKYEQAEPLYQRALAIREQMLGSEHPDTALSYYWLAFISQQQQHYEMAEPLYQRALSIWERRLGLHHPRTSALRRNYASLLRAKGRDEEAIMLETILLPSRRSIQ